MKYCKYIIRILVITYFCTFSMYWFGNDKNIDGNRGIFYLVNNPAIFIGVLIIIVGLFSKKKMYRLLMAGSICSIIGEIISFIYCPIPHITGSVKFSLSMEMTFLGFYISFSILMMIVAMCAVAMKRRAE